MRNYGCCHAYFEGRLCCFAIAWSPEEYGCCHAYFEGRLCEAWSPEEYGKFVRFQCKGCKYLVI